MARRGPSPFCLVALHPEGWSGDHSRVLGVRAPGRGKEEELVRGGCRGDRTCGGVRARGHGPRLAAGRGLCGLRLAAMGLEAPGGGGGAWGRVREALSAHHYAAITCSFSSKC